MFAKEMGNGIVLYVDLDKRLDKVVFYIDVKN
jgi:hypothetical protein